MNQKKAKRRANEKSILLLLMVTLVLPVWGERVDENTARQVATQTLSRSSETHDVDSTTQLRAQAVSQKTVDCVTSTERRNKL